MSAEVDYDAISYVISSRYREVVIDALAETRAATPTQIADSEGVGIAHVSRALGELREKGYVELLVSEDRKKGRLYGLTDEGHGIAEAEAYSGGVSA